MVSQSNAILASGVFLQTAQDFAFFKEMVSKRLPSVVWRESSADDEFEDEGD
jgi:hypothetical protein